MNHKRRIYYESATEDWEGKKAYKLMTGEPPIHENPDGERPAPARQLPYKYNIV